MDTEGAASTASSSAAMELHRCRHFELHKREIGSLRPSLFAHRIGGCEDFIQRFREYKRLSGHRGCVNTVHFNPAGDRLISGSDDKQIIFWDWMAGRKKLSYHSGHEQNVFQARVMPFTDDRSVVTCAADGQVRHGQISENGRVDTKRLHRHRGPAHKLAIEPGSPHTFFSCGEDGTVQHFDLREKNNTKLLTCQSSEGRVKVPVRLNAIIINPRNPNYFAIGGTDEYARVYDIRRIDPGEDKPVSYYAPKHLISFPHIHITCVAYSQQEELLVSYNDELIYLFQKDMGMPEIKQGLRSPDRSDSADSDSSSRKDCREEDQDEEDEEDGNEGDLDEEDCENENGSSRRASEGTDRGPQVYKGHRNSETVKGVNFFGPNTEYVVSGSDCGHIFIWKKRDGKLMAMLKGDKRVVNCLEPHPHAMFMATSGMDKTIKLWAPNNKRKEPFPPNADKIMERNKQSRDNLSNFPFTPEIIMRVLHLQNNPFNDNAGDHEQEQSHYQQAEDDDTGFYNGASGENSDESSDDSLGSPRECIIS